MGVAARRRSGYRGAFSSFPTRRTGGTRPPGAPPAGLGLTPRAQPGASLNAGGRLGLRLRPPGRGRRSGAVTMDYEVNLVDTPARTMLCTRQTVAMSKLGETVMRELDVVWGLIRERGITQTGHNV